MLVEQRGQLFGISQQQVLPQVDVPMKSELDEMTKIQPETHLENSANSVRPKIAQGSTPMKKQKSQDINDLSASKIEALDALPQPGVAKKPEQVKTPRVAPTPFKFDEEANDRDEF